MSAKKKKVEDQTTDEALNAEPVAPDTVETVDEAIEMDVTEEAETIQTEEENPLAVQLEQAEARAAEYLDSLQRERATFQNYKRRVEREREEQAQLAGGRVLTRLLPVLDDFYRAMDAVPDGQRDEWLGGVALILRKFERLLQEEGVTEIEALGQPFDPKFHEAIGVDPDSDAGIVSCVQRWCASPGSC